jgi:Methyltransferase domain
MQYLSFLESVHRQLAPERYLEIGVRNGVSLSLARCRAVGIDPAFSIFAELDCDVALFRTSSDEYFARADPLAATGGLPFDLSFIDGLHLLEFSLRDFINAERHSAAKSVIIFDDVLPRSVDEAARVRHTNAWTGDVYPIIEVLARYRPELTVIPVGTEPTGLLLVMGLDPRNTVLADSYQQIVAEFRRPDPQPVPAAVMDRLTVVAPRRVLDSSFWSVLSSASWQTPPQEIRPELAGRLRTSLGREFAPSPA